MRRTQAAIYLVFAFVLGIFVARLPRTIDLLTGHEDWHAAVVEVHDLIQAKHVKATPSMTLQRGAIDGMVETLGDRYTEFVEPRDAAAFEKQLTGHFVGIGAELSTEGPWPVIATPMEDSPALKAGVMPGDRVVAVDGWSTQGVDIDEVITKVVGEEGTVVRLTVERREGEGEARTIDIAITRGAITAKAVRGLAWNRQAGQWDYVMDRAAGIVYVRVSQFTPTVAKELRAALGQARGSLGRDLAGVVLDLRDNPGGLLDQAVEMVGLFVPEGTLVATTRGREGRGDDRSYLTSAAPILTSASLVVLVNEASASASEVVAGALADHGRAVVVGTRSFGKGLVQVIEPLHALPGAFLKLTEQRYYLPSGRLLHREDDSKDWGVDPSPGFYSAITAEQRTKSVLAMRALGLIRPPGDVGGVAKIAVPAWDSPISVRDALGDPQLAVALEAMQKRAASGVWTPTGTVSPAAERAAISAAERTRLERARERTERDLLLIDRRLSMLEGGAATDLWPDTVNVTGGAVDVFDAKGARVARLKITGPSLEAWLAEADVVPEAAPAPIETGPGGGR